MRWWIPPLWGVVVFALVTFAPAAGARGGDLTGIVTVDDPAIQTEIRAVEQFGFPLSSQTAVVQFHAEGLSPFTQAAATLEALSVDQGGQPYPLLGAIPLTNSFPLIRGSSQRGTAVMTYLFMDPRSTITGQQRAAQRYIREHLSHPGDSVIGVLGSGPARAQQAALVARHLPWLELLTVLVIFLLVGIDFRSVVAPLVALSCSGVALVVTLRLTGIVADTLGLSVPAELEPLLVVLLLGVVTDYTIFYLSGLRERLGPAQPWRRSVQRTVRSVSPIVLAAGLTVAAGTSALLAAKSEFFRAFGPLMALSVLVGVLVSVTLIPAALAILGPRVLWPWRPATATAPATAPGPRATFGQRLARLDVTLARALTRPRIAAAVLLGSCALLTFAALPLSTIQLGVGFTQSLPADNPVRATSAVASSAFAPGISAPTTVLIEGTAVTRQVAALERFQRAVERQPGVAGAFGPAQNTVRLPLDVVLARNGNAARMLVVLDSDPLSARAIGDLDRLRAGLPRLAADAGLRNVTIGVGGDTALAAQLVAKTSSDLWRIALAALLVNFVLLACFLRALVAPLYLLASSVLALASALGLTVWVFQDLRGAGELTFYVPFAAAVLLVSLGSDYNIFGVGRIWHEAERSTLREAIIRAMPRSTRAIGTAAVILSASFGLLALIPVRSFLELAFALSVGVLLDAVVVRSLIVPSLLTLVGPVSSWPSRRLGYRHPPPGAARRAPPAGPAPPSAD